MFKFSSVSVRASILPYAKFSVSVFVNVIVSTSKIQSIITTIYSNVPDKPQPVIIKPSTNNLS